VVLGYFFAYDFLTNFPVFALRAIFLVAIKLDFCRARDSLLHGDGVGKRGAPAPEAVVTVQKCKRRLEHGSDVFLILCHVCFRFR